MALSFFLTDTITKIRRVKPRSGIRSALSATGTSCNCSIQQLAVDAAQQHEGVIGEEYNVFVDVSCVAQKGDQIIIDEIVYEVRGHDVVDPAWASESFKQLVVVKRGRYGS